MVCCPIFTVFDEEHLLLKEYTYWKLLVRNRSTTLGNCVAITKQHHEHFSDVTPEEMKEFNLLVKDVENALQKSFQYDIMNYLMLMMKDKHTHFHIIPRYASLRTFAGVEWIDAAWPGVGEMSIKQTKTDISLEYLQTVKREIKKYL